MTRRPPIPVIIEGDTNLDRGQVNDFAAAFGGNIAHGAGPDYALFRGVEHVGTRHLGKHGSDTHQAILFVYEVDGVRIRSLLWNVWVGQHPDAVRRELEQLLAEHDPDTVVLNEAYRCRQVLRGLPGYRRPIHGPNIGEGADVAVLVARRHQIIRRIHLPMRRRWKVLSKNRVKAGRECRGARVRHVEGPVIRWLGIHGPTNHAVNEPAQREMKNRVSRWATPRLKENG